MIPEVFSIRPDDRMREQMTALLPFYADRATLLRAAVDALHSLHVGPPAVASVIGYDDFVLSQPTVCADTGREMPAGETAWREVWSDGRAGQVFSRAALEADGIL